MIYEKDLDEAIAVCQGERNPTANTCYKLAAYMILKRELFGRPEQPEEPTYSFSAGPPEPVAPLVDYSSDTAFSKAIEGRKTADIWPIMDELMTALQVMLPRLYDSVMRKLNE